MQLIKITNIFLLNLMSASLSFRLGVGQTRLISVDLSLSFIISISNKKLQAMIWKDCVF